VLVRVRPGVKPAVARRSLEQDAIAINNANSETPAGGVVSVLRPAEIANYRAVGSTPAILASILAVGVLAALGLTLLASVRGRRREFAILKTLGFTRRQLAATVVWQASVAAVVGVMFGAPLGIALGRQLWTLFARAISAVPDPTVLGLSVATVAVGALVFANVVALFPAWFAARTPSAIVLRSE
jgi:ABC-type antimicrobial peptide transport system permease subunit